MKLTDCPTNQPARVAREKEAAKAAKAKQKAKQDAEEEVSWQACARRMEQLHEDSARTQTLQRAVDEGYAQVPALEHQVRQPLSSRRANTCAVFNPEYPHFCAFSFNP